MVLQRFWVRKIRRVLARNMQDPGSRYWQSRNGDSLHPSRWRWRNAFNLKYCYLQTAWTWCTMCIEIHIYIYIYVYVYVHIIHTYIYTYIYIYIHTYTYWSTVYEVIDVPILIFQHVILADQHFCSVGFPKSNRLALTLVTLTFPVWNVIFH